MGFHSFANGFAENFDIGSSGATEVDQKIAVELGHLSATDCEPAAPGIVHEIPGAVTRRIFEGRAACAIARLTRFSLFFDRRHFGGDFFGRTGPPLQDCGGENHILRHAAVTILETHLTISELAQVPLTVNALSLNQNILGLAAIRTTIHAQRTADRPGNAA